MKRCETIVCVCVYLYVFLVNVLYIYDLFVCLFLVWLPFLCVFILHNDSWYCLRYCTSVIFIGTDFLFAVAFLGIGYDYYWPNVGAIWIQHFCTFHSRTEFDLFSSTEKQTLSTAWRIRLFRQELYIHFLYVTLYTIGIRPGNSYNNRTRYVQLFCNFSPIIFLTHYLCQCRRKFLVQIDHFNSIHSI